MSEAKKVKLVIVGGGPAGLTAAIYAGRAGLDPVVACGEVRGVEQPGGQLMITTEVENYPGFPEAIEGPELMERFQKQAQRFGAKLINQHAENFEFKEGGPHKVKIGDEQYIADCIICANGASARWLNAEGEEKYRNNGISACATCDGPLPIFRNKHICVVGGGDSAMEEALFLTKFASKVTILHRREELRASKIMQKRALENKKIEFMWNTIVVGYEGSDFLEGIVVKNTKTGDKKTITAAGLFVAIGHQPNTSALKNTPLKLDESGYIVVKDNIHTNIDGVFACGDVHDTVYRQAVSAAGFGCMAAIAAERWLDAKE